VAPPIPDQIPSVFTAGETLKFRRAFNDFPPAEGWTYKIFFNGPTDKFEAAGIADPAATPSGWLVTISADATGVSPGIYRFVERVISGDDEVFSVGEGVVEIEPDLATAAAGVDLSFAEKSLAIIEAEIQARLTADIEDYSVQASSLGGGRSVKKIPMMDLQKLRGHYASMVWRQKNPGKVGAPVKVGFVDDTNNDTFPPTWNDVTGLPGAGQ